MILLIGLLVLGGLLDRLLVSSLVSFAVRPADNRASCNSRRHPAWLQQLDRAGQARQMLGIGAVQAADRQPHLGRSLSTHLTAPNAVANLCERHVRCPGAEPTSTQQGAMPRCPCLAALVPSSLQVFLKLELFP